MSRLRVARISGFLISALLHAALFLFLLKALPTFTPPAPSIVELLNSPVAVAEKPIARDRVNDHRGSIPKFAPSFHPTFSLRSRSGDLAVESSNVEHGPDDPASDWGSGAADFSRVEDLGQFDRLYQWIDSGLSYPTVLAAHQIEGSVNVRLVIESGGHCDWTRTRIQGHEDHLKLYVLDQLQKTCARDLGRYVHKKGPTNLDLSFTFAITGHDDKSLIEQQRKIVGNVFLFYRNSHQSALQWSLGPFRGMFPIPYVAFDFGWLQENYDRVMKSKDPLKEFSEHLASATDRKS